MFKKLVIIEDNKVCIIDECTRVPKNPLCKSKCVMYGEGNRDKRKICQIPDDELIYIVKKMIFRVRDTVFDLEDRFGDFYREADSVYGVEYIKMLKMNGIGGVLPQFDAMWSELELRGLIRKTPLLLENRLLVESKSIDKS